jgi:hypothetical protein
MGNQDRLEFTRGLSGAGTLACRKETEVCTGCGRSGGDQRFRRQGE